jgi:hypothetical protein
MKLSSNNLKNLKQDNQLINYAISYLQNHFSTIKDREIFIKDLLKYGCVTGMVGTLIYYTDTAKFYNKYKSEIWEFVSEYADCVGETPLEVINNFNLSKPNDATTFENNLAWYGFEEAIRQIAEEAEFEV